MNAGSSSNNNRRPEKCEKPYQVITMVEVSLYTEFRAAAGTRMIRELATEIMQDALRRWLDDQKK